MITVKYLKEVLDKYPDDALVHAYEGEDCGIAIRDKYHNLLRWIPAHEYDDLEED